MTRFRDLLLASLEKLPEVPICFSGGVDSATILAGSLALGRKPDCITFRIGNDENEDVRAARAICKAVKVPHHIISIPRSESQLKHDIKRVLAIIPTRMRTHVQCCHPFLYVCDKVKELGYHQAMQGMTIDHLYGSGKNGDMAFAADGEYGFYHIRVMAMGITTTAEYAVYDLCKHEGIELLDPYRDPAFVDFMLNSHYRELHYPKKKAIAIKAFPEFWSLGNWYRKRASFQIVGGIKDWHSSLTEGNPLRVATAYKELENET